MLVKELMDILATFPEDAEVRLAEQPNYPMAHRVAGVVHKKAGEANGYEAFEIKEAPADGVVYVLEGQWIDYASHSLWDEE